MTPEQLAALQKHREERDPLRHYEPRPTALEFHKSNARQLLLTGGNRSGKTSAGLVNLAWLLRGIHPYHKWERPIRVWMWCQSRSQAAAVVGRKLFVKSELRGPCEDHPMIPAWEIEELGKIKLGGIDVYQRCLLKNGSEILFGWSGVESSWKRFQGGQYDIVPFDENACEGDILNESMLRVADARGRYAATEPWRGAIHWFASGTQVDDNFERFRANCLDDTKPDWKLFQIPSSERSADVQETMKEIAADMTDEARRIRIDGDTTAGHELLIYSKQWSDIRHMRPSDYIVQPDDNLWAVYDPGVDHPTGLGFAAINKQNPTKIRFVKYFQQRRLTLEDEVEMLISYLRGRTLEALVYDIAAHKVEKTGLSVKNQLLTILNRRKVRIIRGMIPGRNRHEAGIARVRSYLDPDPVNPFAEPMIEFNPSEESGCQIIRSQMLKYRSFEAGKYTGAKGVVKKDDEGPDVVRYLCSATPGYNPGEGCGHAERLAPELASIPTSESLRDQARFRRSKEMWDMIEGRTPEGGVNLW